MDYLFLHRDKRTFYSERQKNLLFRPPGFIGNRSMWTLKWFRKGKVDQSYKYVLYYLEVRQVFLDPKLSLKKLSDMIETNQTYLSNVVNRYFGCHLKELNEHVSGGICWNRPFGQVSAEELPQRCGFRSRSAFYAVFKKVTGASQTLYEIWTERKARNQQNMYN